MVYHHAQACISSPKVYIISRRLHFFSQWWYTKLRFDDMQFLRNWWYTRLSPWFMWEFKVIRKLGENIFFVSLKYGWFELEATEARSWGSKSTNEVLCDWHNRSLRSVAEKRKISLSPPKIDRFRPVDFLSIAKAMVYHHAQACISSPKVYIISRRLHFFSQWWYTKLRFDDMQFLRNWWYTRLSPWFMQEFEFIRKNSKNIFFVAHRQKKALVKASAFFN